MNQLILFDELQAQRLKTFIEREGDNLIIPEGINTIPFTHGIHRFPGKFIPNLPRHLIREYLAGEPSKTVCDPFCGSGTTLIEACLEKRKYLGIDIDPLAVLISEAKVDALDESELLTIENHWSQYDYQEKFPELIPNVPNLRHWFSEQTILQLSGIKGHCIKLPPRPRKFCLVVFSSIIRRVSNADDQTQKTYVSHTLPKSPPEPSQLFPIFLERAIDGMREYSEYVRMPGTGRVVQGDAKSITNLQEADIITSPPYIDSVDYVYNQMLEYFWLLPELGLHNIDRYRAFRKIPMGFRRIDASTHRFLGRMTRRNRKMFTDLHKGIERKSSKEAALLASFFEDFSAHCDAASLAQGNQGRYICVIGESVIRGITIPTADILEELFISSGYKLLDRMTYEIRRHYMKFPRRSNSGKIKHDHVLIFAK